MKGSIPPYFIQDLVARTDILDIIQPRISLKKKGLYYFACCPFHQENSPSFCVNPTKQFYYCFGCGASGNAIGFLMEFDRLEFIDAVEYLANQLAIDIPREIKHGDTTHTNLNEQYELLEKVTDHYEQMLRKSDDAIRYFKSRKVTGHTAKQFRLGFAPPEWEHLKTHFTDNEQQKLLELNGLIIRKENHKIFDRFRHRIMFPIRDLRGRIIAFGGRTITNEDPKYMNSPETPLFHKSQELYGLYETLQQNRQLNRAIIVEGYMDVVALHQHGIHYAVATLGTASNPRHLQKLFRYTNEVIFCFDGDSAGKTAAWKALLMALPLLRDGIHIRFLFLPEKDDPDSLIHRIGKSGFEQRIESAKTLSTVFFEQLKQDIPPNSPANKADYAKKAMSHLKTMPRGLFRELLLEELAKQLNVYLSDLNQLDQPETKNRVKTQPKSIHRVLSTAEHALALILKEPKLTNTLKIAQEQLDNSHDPVVKLLLVVGDNMLKKPAASTGEIISLTQNQEQQQLLAELASRDIPIRADGLHTEFQDAIHRLLQQIKGEQLQQLIDKAKGAELSTVEKQKLQSLLTQQSNN